MPWFSLVMPGSWIPASGIPYVSRIPHTSGTMRTDTDTHRKLSKEQMMAALDEVVKKRYSVVGDLAVKAVEQAIEAAVSLEEIHFHTSPRTAHASRIIWAKQKFPSLAKEIDALWGAYGALGYEGVDGERAERVIRAMERVLDEIGKNAFWI